MSLASIIKKIEADATAQSEEIIEQARIEDEQITTYARLKAEEEAEQIVRHAEEELQTLKNKQMATALLHMRKEKLDNRQRILSDVFTEVLQRVNSFDDDQRRGIIKTILLSIGEERKGSVLFSQADKSVVNQKFIEEINAELEKHKRNLQFTFSSKTADIERGFIVDFKDFDMNYSVEKILSELWEDIKSEVSTRLFEGK
jgi:vacuolar-type H+-ATPase subunit E/Vma4